MSNYQSPKPRRINYRRIYTAHYGPIPIDEEGRKYDIHHIDGDHTNNDPSNLKAVTIQEHYDIHYSQGDWSACQLIGLRLALSSKDIGKLSSMANKARVASGQHIFVGESNPSRTRITDGTHNLFGGEMQRITQRALVAAGTHMFLGGNIQRRVVAEGRHHFLGSKVNDEMLASGTHPSKIEHTCPHCGMNGRGGGMLRWHFDRCRQRNYAA